MKEEIESLKERNKKVETDKAWEISKTRRIMIAVLTYFIIVILLFTINVTNPWFSAMVPVLGFILSTLTLPVLKSLWVKKIYRE